MRYLLPTALIAILPLTATLAQEMPKGAGTSDDSGYVFTSVVAMMTHKNEYAPVIGAKRNRVFVETPTGVRKKKFGQGGLYVEGAIAIAENYAEIQNLDYSFDNLAQARRDATYQAALESRRMAAEDQISEIRSSRNPVTPGKPMGMSNQEYVRVLEEDMEVDREMQEDSFFSDTEKADTIYLDFEVIPDTNISDAYGVVVASHDDAAGDGRTTVASLEKFGDLQSQVPNKVKFSFGTHEQIIKNLNVKLFLFTGDGLPVATNLSGVVKPVEGEELQALREKFSQRK